MRIVRRLHAPLLCVGKSITRPPPGASIDGVSARWRTDATAASEYSCLCEVRSSIAHPTLLPERQCGRFRSAEDDMKTLITMAVAALSLMAAGVASAQNGTMMNGGSGGMWGGGWTGGYSGLWVPILLVVVVALVAWIVMQKRK
jgi:hypothetical protein